MGNASWPAINAALNAMSAVFLAIGFYAIRKKNIPLHKACMQTAFTVSFAFLMSYLMYHAQVGSVRYTGTGWLRTVYFTILLSHTILAVVIVPLILRTIFLAMRRRFLEHKRWARWTWPLWMYVSVTGVVIYLMLYCF